MAEDAATRQAGPSFWNHGTVENSDRSVTITQLASATRNKVRAPRRVPPQGAHITTGHSGAGGTTHVLHMVEIKVVATVDETSHKEEKEGGYVRALRRVPPQGARITTGHSGAGGTTHALHMVEIKVVATVDETSHEGERGGVMSEPPGECPFRVHGSQRVGRGVQLTPCTWSKSKSSRRSTRHHTKGRGGG